MTTLLVDIAALAEELADPRQHTEPLPEWDTSRNRTVRKVYITTVPGLLEQLREAVYPGNTTQDGNGPRGIPMSRPPLLIEALSRDVQIGLAISGWISNLGLENRFQREANVRALVGAAPHLEHDQLADLRTDLRRWRNWAAVLTGWALPPLTPHVPCPEIDCGTVGALRIILDRRSGYCSACSAVWDDRDSSINVLANYIQAETAKPRKRTRIGSTVNGHGGWAERRTP
jgi:hypothetical protein